ncbi:ABC protein [Athelia psychrophila]|uniref:ABC protein n=1 Tax=Athelia psychrophila TaxID=1759441 RepID=A0A166UHJ7_9AGAM|nr:ABC protein [Fibularhizoctonia sp. CBS 109695]
MHSEKRAPRSASVSDDGTVDDPPKQGVQPTKTQPAAAQNNLQLDTGEEHFRYRRHFFQIWLPKDPPPAARNSLADAPITPLATANIFAQLTFTWITALMVLGYQRTLQAEDLHRLDPSRETEHLATTLNDAWARRVLAADAWNTRLESGDLAPGLLKRTRWACRAAFGTKDMGATYADRRAALEERWRAVDGRREASLAWALNDTLGFAFWIGGVFKVVSDTSQLMAPLIIKAIITFGQEHYAAKAAGVAGPSIGRGVGLAVGAFMLNELASICTHQYWWRSMGTGILARGALIGAVYKRSVHLSGKARTTITNAALMNHLSTDISRVDSCAQWFHAAWTAPIQVIVCLIILLSQLGVSALAGFALFAFVFPIQRYIMSLQLGLRRRSMRWTDQRARLLVEVFSTMRVVKYFSYEVPFLQRLNSVREKELVGIRRIQHAFSANLAFSLSVPVLSATLAFVTYTSIQPAFNSAVIFSSMGLFQLLRQPLMNLPRALSSIPDALSALTRLQRVFHAPLLAGAAIDIDAAQGPALVVDGAVFQWESVPPAPKGDTKKDKGKSKDKAAAAQPAPAPEKQEERVPFKVEVPEMTVPRGSLVAIVGPVGSGKSSLLQGLIGEMRRDAGRVSFGGRVSYCPQSAWIQNATLASRIGPFGIRNNIIFGQPFDEDRYWEAVDNASLLPDLDALPDGDATEIGEKGINLSGGQKQRVNIARALYANADVVIMDDPLSAVDAHVGKALFENAILGAFRGKGASVILVTHALHFLSQCDYIYTVKDGRIVEHGTHKELVAKAGEFARLDKAYGAGEAEVEQADDIADDAAEAAAPGPAVTVEAIKKKLEKVYHKSGTGKDEGRLIAREKRETGSVKWSVYGAYIRAGKGWITLPLIIAFMILMQSSQIMNSYVLVWWEDDTFHRSSSFYQTIYACLGVSQAIFTLLMGTAMDYMANFASNSLHRRAVQKIFYSPMSFFDTTPTGRILSVLQKDIDTIDNQLAMTVRLFVITMASVAGSIILIAVLEVYFLAVVVVIIVLYGYFAMFYQASARELKRIDSLLRSIHYAHFSESLTGLPTIRSYGAIDRFINDNKYYLDLENRALFLTVTNQRWLAVRLDFLGSILVFAVSIFSVVGISGISPAQIGVVLTYTATLSQWGSAVTRQTAQVHNNMNSVERVVEYSRDGGLEQEKPHEIEDTKPPSEWPEHGAIEFKNIVMSYRPGLPIVLKGLSVDIKGGEKIGVVGRTGAGKSSLMLALFRIVELTSGSITIDGVDISTIGLKDLRTKISIIPQDPLLFAGTIRSNLDPFSVLSDAQLWDALHKSYLTEASSSSKGDEDDGQHSAPRYNLDTVIEDDGANLSVGERSLLSLARALVKDSKVIVMDEATASVDLDTDNKIQKTIQELQGRTLLTIAHRLRTIISYDRILVLDAGTVAEFDTPRNLFGRDGGIFCSMCEQSGISLEDILASTS